MFYSLKILEKMYGRNEEALATSQNTSLMSILSGHLRFRLTQLRFSRKVAALKYLRKKDTNYNI